MQLLGILHDIADCCTLMCQSHAVLSCTVEQPPNFAHNEHYELFFEAQLWMLYVSSFS